MVLPLPPIQFLGLHKISSTTCTDLDEHLISMIMETYCALSCAVRGSISGNVCCKWKSYSDWK